MKTTNTNALVIAILGRGWKEIPSKTSKARTFSKDVLSKKLYVGRAGSCRFGTCYSKSRPISRRSYQAMLLEGFQKIKTAHENK